MNDCLLGSSHRIPKNNTFSLPSGAENGRNEFTVGYGPGGGDPFEFEPNEHLFFKFFASGDYCDWSFIQQGDVFDARRGRQRPHDEVDFRGAWVLGVVGKNK